MFLPELLFVDICLIMWSRWSMLQRDSNISRRVHNGKPRHRRVVLNQVQISFWNVIQISCFQKVFWTLFSCQLGDIVWVYNPLEILIFYIIWYGMDHTVWPIHTYGLFILYGLYSRANLSVRECRTLWWIVMWHNFCLTTQIRMLE